MNTKVIGISITAFIGIIVLGSVLMPILDDATATTDTFTNEGFFYVDSLAENETITYSCNGTTAYVNGVPIPGEYSTGYPGGASIAYTENFIIRWAGSGNYAIRGVYWAFDANASSSITFSGDGTYSGTYGTAEFSGTWTTFYGLVNKETSRIMSSSTADKFVNSDSTINGTGLTQLTTIGQYAVFNLDGSIEDGITVKAYSQTNGSELTNFEISNIVINYTEVPDYLDLYNISSITFTVTDTSDSDSDNVTYSVFTIPTEVSAERAEHLSAGQNQLLLVIPVMIIVAILMAVVVLVIRSKLE